MIENIIPTVNQNQPEPCRKGCAKAIFIQVVKDFKRVYNVNKVEIDCETVKNQLDETGVFVAPVLTGVIENKDICISDENLTAEILIVIHKKGPGKLPENGEAAKKAIAKAIKGAAEIAEAAAEARKEVEEEAPEKQYGGMEYA